MTKAEVNYTETTKCCKCCKHFRTTSGQRYCSILDPNDWEVEKEDVCDSFKGVW